METEGKASLHLIGRDVSRYDVFTKTGIFISFSGDVELHLSNSLIIYMMKIKEIKGNLGICSLLV